MPSELKCRIIRARILRADPLKRSFTLQNHSPSAENRSNHYAAYFAQLPSLEMFCELRFNDETKTSEVFQPDA